MSGLKITSCVKVGPNTFRVTTESEEYGTVTQDVLMMPGPSSDPATMQQKTQPKTTDDVYASIIRECLAGERITTRNSVCFRTFARQVRFTSTPLVCSRKTSWKNCLREWEWFMSGSNAIEDLHPSVRHWWMPWAADEQHYGKPGLGPDFRVAHNYSEQFRYFQGRTGYVDQIQYLIDGIRNHPFSRRNVITTWNTADMAHPECKITNCHNSLTQAFVDTENRLHLVTYQRSVDVICGLPHNWAQEWAFLLWLAHLGGRLVGSLTWIGGDVHVYEAHLPLAEKILAAPPQQSPEMVYRPTSEEFLADDFSLDREYAPVVNERAEMIV